MIFEHHKTGH